MDHATLARELERIHADSWGWALACAERDHALAEDALQTAYLRVLSGDARFAGRSTFRSWVFGVIRLTALEELRRRRRWDANSCDASHASHAVDPAPGADVTTEAGERIGQLLRALEGLSPRQREVIQLVFYHGMTIEEAATVMRVSTGSARTHYDRGKKALARELERAEAR